MGNQDGASHAFYSMLVMLIAFSFIGLDRCFCKQLMMCNKNFVIVALNKTDSLANLIMLLVNQFRKNLENWLLSGQTNQLKLVLEQISIE